MQTLSTQKYARWNGSMGYAWHVIVSHMAMTRLHSLFAMLDALIVLDAVARMHMKEFGRVFAEIGLNAAGVNPFHFQHQAFQWIWRIGRQTQVR